jgi:hypothetical protein
MVQTNEWSTSSGVEILNTLMAAPSFELRAIGHDGSTIAATEFDSTEHARVFDGFAEKVAEVEENYFIKVGFEAFDCELEAPL